MKKLNFLIALLCVITSWSATFAAVNPNPIIYKYNTTTKTAVVRYFSKNLTDNSKYYKDTVDIPSSVTYNSVSYKVTSIGDSAFYNCSALKYIIIPNTITSIGDKAFYNCSSLKKIVIPSSVTTIGAYAFYGTTNADLTIPSSVTTIGGNAFASSKFFNSQPKGVIYVNNIACDLKGDTTTIVIKDGTVKIAPYALESYYNTLKYLTIPSSVTEIGEESIQMTSAMYSITLKMTTLPKLPTTSIFNSNTTNYKPICIVPSIKLYRNAAQWSSIRTNMTEGIYFTTNSSTNTKVTFTSITAHSVVASSKIIDPWNSKKGFCYYANTIKSIEKAPKIEVGIFSNNTITDTITNLLPNTKYYVFSYVTTCDTTYYSYYYYDSSFTTLTNTAVNDVYLENINIYPNPTKGKVFIKSDTNFPMNSVVNLFSISGKKICSTIIQDNGLLFDLSDYNLKGMYLIQIMNTDNTVLINKKLIFE